MRFITYLLAGVSTILLSNTNAVITDDPLCNCTTCCYIDDSTNVDFTGKTIVSITYPNVSYSGEYTVLNHQGHNGVNTTMPFQYVFKYNNGFKTSFDRNVLVFADTNGTVLNCSDSFVFYGDPESTKYKQLGMVETVLDQSSYCTLDVNGRLTRDEIADDSGIYFAFNTLVNEMSSFNIMYDLNEQGLILAEEDILVYPYIIQGGSVAGTDEAGGGEFYMDIVLNVTDIDETQAGIDPSCLSIDELFEDGNAQWYVEGGENCNVTVLSSGDGDPEGAGRQYHLKVNQFQFETCSFDTRESGDQLHFDFRLVLPVQHTDTNSAVDDTAECNYFQEPLNVQNITINMDQDVSDEITSHYITEFQPVVTKLTPAKCTDYNMYPNPHITLKIELNASFPTANAVDFDTIGATTFGESWENNVLLWDDNAGGTIPQYICTSYVDPIGDGNSAGFTADDYTDCVFKFISSKCEPIYETLDGECALERNTTRYIEGFSIEQTLVGGMTATYNGGSINSGVDNTEWDIDFCVAEGEREIVNMQDYFETIVGLRNYYTGVGVDWDNTTLLNMQDDMILRFSVGEKADTDFTFTSDLSLIIKTATVTISNPLSGNAITSYVFSATDKAAFMGYSWTPYHTDPRFCKWYDSGGGNDKCTAFFVDGERSNTYHDETWINNIMPSECQDVNTFNNANTDTNNADFFVFTPREWFRDNTQGFVEMKIEVTGVVHKCTDARRVLEDAGKTVRGRELTGPNAETDVLYISDEIIVSFVTDVDGGEHVEVRKPPGKSWFDENSTLVIVGASIIGVIVLTLVYTGMKNRGVTHTAMPYIMSSSRPEF